MTEHQLQSACVHLFRNKYHKLAGHYFAIPNGMWSKNIAIAIKQKKEGLTKGVFDTFLMYASGNYHGLWIEFKVGANKLTPEQKAFKLNTEISGYKAVVVYTVEQFIGEIEGYLNDK